MIYDRFAQQTGPPCIGRFESIVSQRKPFSHVRQKLIFHLFNSGLNCLFALALPGTFFGLRAFLDPFLHIADDDASFGISSQSSVFLLHGREPPAQINYSSRLLFNSIDIWHRKRQCTKAHRGRPTQLRGFEEAKITPIRHPRPGFFFLESRSSSGLSWVLLLVLINSSVICIFFFSGMDVSRATAANRRTERGAQKMVNSLI